jgi:lysophospholipase L1-like esterase
LGDTFDFMIQTNGTAANLLYLNRTDGQGGQGVGDIATISHHAKGTSTREGSYTMAAAGWRHLSVTGGGTIGTVQIGWEPVVIFGDSMASYSGRYGQYLPGAFTYPRMHWRAQISGNRLQSTSSGNHTAGWLRYKHTTIGLGDLCELRDVVFCFAGYGLNDISLIGTNPANVPTVTAGYFDRFDAIIADLQANGNQPLVIGLAPYHHVPNASEQEAQAIIAWIAEYADRADASLFAWITPWWDLVDQSTASDPIPKIRAEYTSDSGTHINATATQAIVPLVAQAYESGFVGGVWSRSFRRYRQVFP